MCVCERERGGGGMLAILRVSDGNGLYSLVDETVVQPTDCD